MKDTFFTIWFSELRRGIYVYWRCQCYELKRFGYYILLSSWKRVVNQFDFLRIWNKEYLKTSIFKLNHYYDPILHMQMLFSIGGQPVFGIIEPSFWLVCQSCVDIMKSIEILAWVTANIYYTCLGSMHFFVQH